MEKNKRKQPQATEPPEKTAIERVDSILKDLLGLSQDATPLDLIGAVSSLRMKAAMLQYRLDEEYKSKCLLKFDLSEFTTNPES